MALTLFDFWLVPIFALGLQIWATMYLVKIHRIIGVRWTIIFIQFQLLGYLYIAYIMDALLIANDMGGVQPLENFQIFFGLIYPVWNNITHLKMKQYLSSGLQPTKKKEIKDGSAFS